MIKKSQLVFILPTLLFIACTGSNIKKIENKGKNHLGTKTLEMVKEKRINLDSISAPRPAYIQIYTDNKENRFLTFLNKYDNSIYFYSYDNLAYVNKIRIKSKMDAFYIKSIDSIYVYNRDNIEMLQVNSRGDVSKHVSLINNLNLRKDRWYFLYPQYSPQTAIPFFFINNELYFTGQLVTSIPERILKTFKFTARIDFGKNKASFIHTYPTELYGDKSNWVGKTFTEVYPELHPSGNKIIYSFPVTHDLYIANLDSNNYNIVYGGSKEAGTIKSLKGDQDEGTSEEIRTHALSNDQYAAIRYDKYRNVYYRFLRKAVKRTNNEMDWKNRELVVVILDENFNYLGEKKIGKLRNWVIKNTFVTKEGLNIEYVENLLDESKVIIKIFNPITIK